MANCVVCNSDAQIDASNIHELKITCTSCGRFSITDVALNTIPKDVDPNWRSKLQKWIRLHPDEVVTTSVIKTIF